MQVTVILAFIVSLLIQVGYPLGVILLYRRRAQTTWAPFFYGALVFAVFQMFTWLPFSAFVEVGWGERVSTAQGAFVWLMAMAALTALVEEGGRALGYRYLFPRNDLRLTWRNGVAYGLGHNALETMWLIAGLTFVSFIAYLLAGPFVAAGAADAPGASSQALLAVGNVSWRQPVIVALERVFALPHQVAWALLVMESQVSRQKRWFGFAFLYHTSIAVIIPGLGRLSGFVLAEGVNLIFAVLSLWIILKLRQISAQRDQD
ncbi:MAG: YhfC family glutamic-type intramembrane protease [Anaerolineae bacterium]|nr:YhfC family intramembrane metalloprotease [Chloroflexota bacterium]